MLPQGIRLEVRGHGADERFYAVEYIDCRVGWMSGPMTELECRTWLADANVNRADIDLHMAAARAERKV
jgi:hypothetical protein